VRQSGKQQPDLPFEVRHAGGGLHQAQAQGVELHDPPREAPRHRRAQVPHHPIRTGVQEQPPLVAAIRKRISAALPVPA
jgi:hypothetical protein